MYWLIIPVVYCIVWAIVCSNVIINKGYEEESNKWAVYGFLFGIFAFFVAISKKPKEAEQQLSPSDISPKTEYRKEDILTKGGWICRFCGKTNVSYEVMCSCGKSKRETDNYTEPVVTVTNVADEIRSFKALLDDGIITQEEFEKKKKELLDK